MIPSKCIKTLLTDTFCLDMYPIIEGISKKGYSMEPIPTFHIPIIAAIEISPEFTNSNPAIRLKISVRYTPPENIPLLSPIAEATFL